MTRLAMSDLGADYARIFGPRESVAPGERVRRCKVCEGWHRIGAWPHNCRSEAPPRSKLAAPQLAPKFHEHVAGSHDAPVPITDRREQREYMARHDLVLHDPGIRQEQQSARAWKEEFVADWKAVREMDPLNRPPIERVGEADTGGAGEIDTNGIEVFGD